MDTKNFAINQQKAEMLVISTIPEQYKLLQQVQSEMEDVDENIQNMLTKNKEFLDENGFTSAYRIERKSRLKILLFTPIFSGLSIATGVNIIFGLNIALAILIGILISVVSFFLALKDKVLENKSTDKASRKKNFTYLLFLAIDAVVLIVGLLIGLSNGIPIEYMVIHTLLCLFAVALNFSMLKHSEKYNEDKVRADIKERYDKLNGIEGNKKTQFDKFAGTIRSQITELATMAVNLRGNFVSNNYNPSLIRMSQETRMVLNQFFGYDLFPVVGDMILAPDFVWNRQQLTTWSPDTTSIYPEVLPVFGSFASRSRFILDRTNSESQPIAGALSDSNSTTEGGRSNNSTVPPVNNPASPNNPTSAVNQTPESENEL